MPKIKIAPTNVEVEVEDGANLRSALIENGITVKSPCGGCASCSQCVVVVKEGGENLSDVSFEEKQLLGNVFHITSERLSCQSTVYGDVSIDVSAHIVKKAKPKTMRRTKEEAEDVIAKRIEKAKERPQRQGGMKRPKPFK